MYTLLDIMLYEYYMAICMHKCRCMDKIYIVQMQRESSSTDDDDESLFWSRRSFECGVIGRGLRGCASGQAQLQVHENAKIFLYRVAYTHVL